MRRAWLRIVEVAIAAALLLVFFAYISSLVSVQRPSFEETSTLSRTAQNALTVLDNTYEGQTTILRARVNDRDYAKLLDQTREIVPDEYRFRYIIGDEETGEIPPKTEVVHQTYFVVLSSGETETVRLYLWRRD